MKKYMKKEKANFKVGDRVRITPRSFKPKLVGRTGEIVFIASGLGPNYAVKIDGWHGGHDCFSEHKYGCPNTGDSGWFFGASGLELLEPSEDTKEEAMMVADLLGEYERVTYGHTIDDMLQYERSKARNELRDKVMAQFGYKYQYISENKIGLVKIDNTIGRQACHTN